VSARRARGNTHPHGRAAAPLTITSISPGRIPCLRQKVSSVAVVARTRSAAPPCAQPSAPSTPCMAEDATDATSSGTADEKGPAADSSTTSPSRSPSACSCTATRAALPAWRARAAAA